jgi:hypothetical protein
VVRVRVAVGGVAATLVLVFGVVAAVAGVGPWKVVSSPNPQFTNVLAGVAVLGADDAWSVGATGPSESGPLSTLVEQWDGTSWSVVASPSPGGSDSLASVSATGADDVWAVGETGASGLGPFSTLVEHWDGAGWSVVVSPSPGDSSSLSGVAALSGSDAWAVGSMTSGGVQQALVEHWDGAGWSVVASPSPGDSSSLSGVAALSGSDAWAVGSMTSGGVQQALVEHWDGTSWNVVASPALAGSGLASVSPLRENDVWAVGDTAAGGVFTTLTEHWDGTSWTVVPSPSPGTLSVLLGVSAVRTGNVWAVGDANTNPAQPFYAQALIEHWDGSNWTVTQSRIGNTGSYLAGIDFALPKHGITVGSTHTASGQDLTLIQQFAHG